MITSIVIGILATILIIYSVLVTIGIWMYHSGNPVFRTEFKKLLLESKARNPKTWDKEVAKSKSGKYSWKGTAVLGSLGFICSPVLGIWIACIQWYAANTLTKYVIEELEND